MSGAELVEALAFEEAWDGMLGGRELRPYREVLLFAVGGLVRSGVSLENVLVYAQASTARGPSPAAPR